MNIENSYSVEEIEIAYTTIEEMIPGLKELNSDIHVLEVILKNALSKVEGLFEANQVFTMLTSFRHEGVKWEPEFVDVTVNTLRLSLELVEMFVKVDFKVHEVSTLIEYFRYLRDVDTPEVRVVVRDGKARIYTGATK